MTSANNESKYGQEGRKRLHITDLDKHVQQMQLMPDAHGS